MREKENQPDTDTLTQESKEEGKRIIRQHKSILKKELSERKITEGFKQLKYCAEYCLNIKLYDLNKNFNTENFFCLEDRNNMLHVVMCYCLMTWFENDEQFQQTLREFAKTPYNDINLKPDEDFKQSDVIEKTLRNYEKWYRDNIALQNKQAQKEGILYKKIRYTANSREKTNQINNQNKDTKKRKYDFIELRFLELLEERKLEIYRCLFYHKKPLDVITNEKKDALLDAYIDYAKIPKELLVEKSARKFVAGYLQLVKFETTYRFFHAAHLVQYMMETNLSPQMQLPCALVMHYYRLSLDENYPQKVADTQFVGKYQKMDQWLTYPATILDCIVIKEMRNIMEATLHLVAKIFPISARGPWTEQDYENAKSYFMSDISVLYEYAEFDFDKYKNNKLKFSEYVRNLYNNPGFVDQNLFTTGHDTLHNKNKNRYKKKNKNKNKNK